MKNFVSVAAFTILVGLLISCGTTGPYLPSASDENIIGTIQTTFQLGLGYPEKMIKERAYSALLEAAKKEYQGNIDIRDITWRRGHLLV